jgi:hypothetical protein
MATRLLTDVELADEWNWSVHTLRADRQNKRRIPFYKFGRSVRYDPDKARAALDTFQIGGEARPKTKARRVELTPKPAPPTMPRPSTTRAPARRPRRPT